MKNPRFWLISSVLVLRKGAASCFFFLRGDRPILFPRALARESAPKFVCYFYSNARNVKVSTSKNRVFRSFFRTHRTSFFYGL